MVGENGREINKDERPHFVICGSDALVYTVTEELSNVRSDIRLTVITPAQVHAEMPDLADLGVRVIQAEHLDERTFREAGLAGAAALALVMPDDMINIHAALCARAVEGNLRLVLRMYNTGLGTGVRNLFADCAVLSDAAMAAPAFVAAALGEVAPTHFRHAGRTLHVARRGDVPPETVVCTLGRPNSSGRLDILPPEPRPGEASPTDPVLVEATGHPVAQAVTAHSWVRSGRRGRQSRSIGRVLRAGLSSKLSLAVLGTFAVCIISGTVLARADHVDGLWRSLYITILTAVGASNVDPSSPFVAQLAQIVLSVSGVVLIPLSTAAVVDGVVKTRLALTSGRIAGVHVGHIVLVGLGNVGTRVLRQLHDLGLDVVAVDRSPDARGIEAAEKLGVPLLIADASRAETLRAASIATCRALVVLSTDDTVNLQAALHARAARADIRVVLRLFDDDFARRVQTAFNITISRSVSRLCAPAFAAAMLERDILATIPVERHALLVATVKIAAHSELDGRYVDDIAREPGARVIGMSNANSNWVDWTRWNGRRLTPGDELVVVARRAGLRELVDRATLPKSALSVD